MHCSETRIWAGAVREQNRDATADGWGIAMLGFLRRAYLMACGAAGVYGAYRLMEVMVYHATHGKKFHFNGESMLVAVPVLGAGLVLGLLIGSLIIPRRLG